MGFELSYSITAEPCMESVICYGMESMQSIVWNQAAGKYTFGDAIRLRQFHTRRRVMPYQACGLNATKMKKQSTRDCFFILVAGEGLVRSLRRNSKRSAASATTSGLSLRARLRLPKKSSCIRCPRFFRPLPEFMLTSSSTGCVRNIPLRAPLVVLITQRTYQVLPKTKKSTH